MMAVLAVKKPISCNLLFQCPSVFCRGSFYSSSIAEKRKIVK
jgi:hypothetical protein